MICSTGGRCLLHWESGLKMADQRYLRSAHIVPANDGGFVVMSQTAQIDFNMRSFDFAGTLDECLEYARAVLSAPDPQIQGKAP